MLIRMPDDLHARLTEHARRTKRSANAVVNEILERGVADEGILSRAVVRSRARRLGVLASPPIAAVAEPDREAALATMRGVRGLDAVLDDGR